MLPTKLLITCTCFQRITSYLVHTNFSSCMIILQSFQFVSQVVRLLCSLQNVFQMSPLALQGRTKLSMTRTHSSVGIAPIMTVIAEFKSTIVWGLFSYTRSLKLPQRYKSAGVKSGECGAHSTSHLTLMSRSSNRCLSHNRMLLEM